MTLHTKISYAKSALRIIGYLVAGFAALPTMQWVSIGMFILLMAELLGVAEELPGAYKGTKTE
jgi:hypothetical protein